MLKHFYRFMVVILAALTATAVTGCVATDYGDIPVDFDEDIVADEDVAESEAITPDDDSADKEWGDPAYGSPTTTYSISGRVTSRASGSRIAGIQITSLGLSITSDEKGDFSIYTEHVSYPVSGSVVVKAEDVDGALNGEFQTKEVSVKLTCTSPRSWEENCTASDIKIELEEATPDDDNLLSDVETSDDDTLGSD